MKIARLISDSSWTFNPKPYTFFGKLKITTFIGYKETTHDFGK